MKKHEAFQKKTRCHPLPHTHCKSQYLASAIEESNPGNADGFEVRNDQDAWNGFNAANIPATNHPESSWIRNREVSWGIIVIYHDFIVNYQAFIVVSKMVYYCFTTMNHKLNHHWSSFIDLSYIIYHIWFLTSHIINYIYNMYHIFSLFLHQKMP